MAKQSNKINKLVGEKIRALRNDANISQEGFADQCGLHRTYIGSVERGERNITLRSLEKIAKTLGVSIRNLLPED